MTAFQPATPMRKELLSGPSGDACPWNHVEVRHAQCLFNLNESQLVGDRCPHKHFGRSSEQRSNRYDVAGESFQHEGTRLLNRSLAMLEKAEQHAFVRRARAYRYIHGNPPARPHRHIMVLYQ